MLNKKLIPKLILFLNPLISISLPGGARFWGTSLSFIFIIFSISGSLDQFNRSMIFLNDSYWLIFALIFSWLSLIINALAWKALFKWLGIHIRAINAVELFLSTNIFKYLPGGIWHFITRYKILKNYLKANESFLVVFLEPFLMLSAALFWIPFTGAGVFLSFLCLLPAFLFSVIFKDFLIKQIYRLKAKKLSKSEFELLIDENLTMYNLNTSFYPFNAFFIEMLFIIFKFIGFLCVLKAFSIAFEIDFVKYFAAFIFAWSVGLVIPSAPGGLGIFEATFLAFFPDDLVKVQFIPVLIIYRIILSIVDILASIIIPARIKQSYLKLKLKNN